MELSMNGDFQPQHAPDARRHIFAIELKAGSRTEYVWDPTDISYVKKILDDDEYDGVRQTLMLRRVIAGEAATENESNLVSVEVSDPDGETTSFPLAYVAKGHGPQTNVDITFPESQTVKVKFTLAVGSGPVHVIGYHFVERLPADDPDYVSEAEEDPDLEGEEEDASTDEALDQVKARAPIMRVKRRIQVDGNGGLQKKKMKVGSENNGAEAAAVAADEDMEKDVATATAEKGKDDKK